MQVPLLDLRAQYAPLKSQFLAAIEEVCDSQALVLGPKTEALEAAVARYCDVPHAVACSSGTDAQLMLLMALGIGPGDAVLTTPYTFFATASCIARLGATPVFADIDPATYNLCPRATAATLEAHPHIKAIVPVHLFGCCADLEAFITLGKKYGIPVLEDAAQALGARHPLGAAGAVTEAGWFSFYPTKNLGAFGDAGMVVCHDDALAAKLRALRNHGMEVRYYHQWIGGNFRIDAIQSAVLSVKLPHLDTWSAARRANAQAYREAFIDLPLTQPAEPWAGTAAGASHHIYNQFIIRTPHRDALRAHLQTAGVGTEIYYPLCLHQQACFSHFGHRKGDFPEAERAAAETLAIPIYPELTEAQRNTVIKAIRGFFEPIS